MRFSQPMTRNLQKCIEEVQNCPEPTICVYNWGVLVQWCLATLARCSVQSVMNMYYCASYVVIYG
jgi:hypothetical protein